VGGLDSSAETGAHAASNNASTGACGSALRAGVDSSAVIGTSVEPDTAVVGTCASVLAGTKDSNDAAGSNTALDSTTAGACDSTIADAVDASAIAIGAWAALCNAAEARASIFVGGGVDPLGPFMVERRLG